MQAAADVARLAGDVALKFYRTRLTVDAKADGSEVTEADRSAERAARVWIEKHFPGDGILGEEFGESNPGAARRWILDPIDGTRSFVRGVPLWGTLVAVAEGETILAGAANYPAVEEIAVAAPGLGCWWNETRCHVSSVGDLAKATVLTTDDRFRTDVSRRHGWERLAERALTSRTWGDCYGYLLVATGRAEVMVDDILSPWDAAAVMPIVIEAGGVFTDWGGIPTAFGGDAIATNAALAEQARFLLSDPID